MRSRDTSTQLCKSGCKVSRGSLEVLGTPFKMCLRTFKDSSQGSLAVLSKQEPYYYHYILEKKSWHDPHQNSDMIFYKHHITANIGPVHVPD